MMLTKKQIILSFIPTAFILILGILFLVRTHFMIEFAGYFIGAYFLFSALIQFFAYYIERSIKDLATGIFYSFLSLISFLFAGFWMRYFFFVLGILFILSSIFQFLNLRIKQYFDFPIIEELILAILKMISGILIFSFAFQENEKPMGIVIGICFILLAIFLGIKSAIELHIQMKMNLLDPTQPSISQDQVIEGEIISEQTKDIHDQE